MTPDATGPWPIVELGTGPPAYIDRVLGDQLLELKRVLAHGTVDGVAFSLTAFRHQPDPPREGFAADPAEGRTIQLFLGDEGSMGGEDHSASVPAHHEISVTSIVYGDAPDLVAYFGVASEVVATLRVEADAAVHDVALLDAGEGFPVAFVAFAPAGLSGEIVARDRSGSVIDREPFADPGHARVRPRDLARRVRSDDLFQRATRVIPGGVNSPVRAFGAVGGTPRFVDRAEGAHLFDVDGNRLLDLVMSWGALLHGHAHPEVLDAALAAARRGSSFGAPTEGEVQLAEAIVAAVPSVERVRLVSSGTEAAMSAIRLTRGFTGRSKLLKFAGCYHGHSDALLAESGSGVATFGIPGSAGVTPGAVADTIVVPFNDLEAVRQAFQAARDELACVIVEPVAANMGVVPPTPGCLEELRELSSAQGALLVLDEVITGFRLGRGGAQERFGIEPDLTVLGKVVGGGYPLAAFGGRADVMGMLSPEGPVYQAGTLSGNPVAVAAGLAALRIIERDPPYERLERLAAALSSGLQDVFAEAGEPAAIAREGSLLSLFVGAERGPVNLDDARRADHARYAAFFHAMLDRGVYLPPSGYEAWFLSTAHTTADVERTVEAARQAVRAGALATSGS